MRGLPIFIVAALALPTLSSAAEVTDMPTALRGDVAIDYRASFLSGDLVQDGKAHGSRAWSRHDVQYTLEFAPIDGLAVHLAFDTTPYSKLSFQDPQSMEYDPVTEEGTYEGSRSISAPDRLARGLNGVWIGVAVAPFAEWFARQQEATWRLDVAFRTPNPGDTFWADDGDWRGTAPGGAAWKLRGAFSTTNEPANPYLVGQYIHEGTANVDVVDESGTTLGTDVAVQAASEIDITAGVELIAAWNPETQERFAFDLNLAFGYRSPAKVASGVLLPDVLPQTRGTSVTESEHLLGSAGAGLDYHLNQYFGARAGYSLTYVLPHRLEHVYPVMTGYDTLSHGVYVGIEGRIR